MDRLVSIGEASKILGVSITTLRRWDKMGRLTPEKTTSGHRRYDISKLKPEVYREPNQDEKKTIAYARVSSHTQKHDLERQKNVLEVYCSRQGWTYEVISDLGSGVDYHKKGLKRLINDILSERIGRLVIIHKDSLLRFGTELIFAVCEAKNVEVVILNQERDMVAEDDLASDVLEIITVFSTRLYGSKSAKSQKLLDDVTKILNSVNGG